MILVSNMNGGQKYLVNAFSLNMIRIERDIELKMNIRRIDIREFGELLRTGGVVNAIGHQGMIDLINTLFNTDFKMNRIEVRLQDGDELLLIQVRMRLPEGRVLNKEELNELLGKGLIEFYHIRIGIRDD